MTDVLAAPDGTPPRIALGEFREFSRAAPGGLEVRLARDRGEVAAAQALRFRVFHEEMGARSDAAARANRRDADPFDDVCDHLLVVDHGLPAAEAVVGTCQLLREDAAGGRPSSGPTSASASAPWSTMPSGPRTSSSFCSRTGSRRAAWTVSPTGSVYLRDRITRCRRRTGGD